MLLSSKYIAIYALCTHIYIDVNKILYYGTEEVVDWTSSEL